MFTQEGIALIQQHKYVKRCSATSITYSEEFKALAAVKYYEEGYSPTMIFEEAGFDLNIIGRSKPKECLKRWRKKYRKEGVESLLQEKRGRPRKKRKKSQHQTDKERIEYLEAKISYLDAENDFLARLRGLKRE